MPIIKRRNAIQNLDLISVDIEDTSQNSPNFFNVYGLPAEFPAGKTAFLINGSDNLILDSEVKVEILDPNRNVIYTQPVQYLEGVSRLVSVFVYPDDAFGEATLTIVGDVFRLPPGARRNLPNVPRQTVRWSRKILLNPSLKNTSEIRFFQDPRITVSEILKPYITKRYGGAVFTGSETFNFTDGTITGQAKQNEYVLVSSGFDFTGQMVGATVFVDSPVINDSSVTPTPYTTSIIEVRNSSLAVAEDAYQIQTDEEKNKQTIEQKAFKFPPPNTYNFSSTPYTMSILAEPTYSETQNVASFARVRVANMTPFSGDVNQVRLFMKSEGSVGDYELVADQILESIELLVDSSSIKFNTRTGYFFTQSSIDSFWSSSKYPSTIADANLVYRNDKFIDAMLISGSDERLPLNSYYRIENTLPVEMDAGAEYTFEAKFHAIKKAAQEILSPERSFGKNNKVFDVDLAKIQVYASGSAIVPRTPGKRDADEDPRFGKLIQEIELTSNSIPNEKGIGRVTRNFTADKDGTGTVIFVVYAGDWHISDVSVKLGQETGFSPDLTTFYVRVPDIQKNDPIKFKAEFYDVNNNKASTVITSSEFVFEGGNSYIGGTNNLITGSVFIGNLTGSGIELAGVESAFIRTIGYQGYVSASNHGTNPGLMFWSGTITLGDTTDEYDAVGFELHGGSGSAINPDSGIGETHALRFRTDTGILEITGAIVATFISASAGEIGGWQITTSSLKAKFGSMELFSDGQIYTDEFIVNADGDVTASNFLFEGGRITGSDVYIEVPNFELDATNIEISSVNASMSLGETPDRITLQGGTYPYISIAQSTIGFQNAGIFVGYDGSSTERLSLEGSTSDEFLRWDGTKLTISGSGFSIDEAGTITASAGIIGGFTITDDALVGADFYLSGSPSAPDGFFISASNFNVRQDGDVTGSSVYFDGGTIANWLITPTLISGSNLLLDPLGTIQTADFVSDLKGWRLTSQFNGLLEVENAKIRGTLSTTQFTKESVNVVGGQLWVANSTQVSGTVVSTTETTWSVDNATAWETDEIAIVKKFDATGFSTEYIQIVSSSLEGDGESTFNGKIYVTRNFGASLPTGSSQVTGSLVGDTGSAAGIEYSPGQVIVSTGRIGTGYVRVNANPRDYQTPYIDIIERTGSGVYDLELKVRVGDLKGLSPSLLFGETDPGFGIYTENGFFYGAVTAVTGNFIGIVHAGDVQIGQNVGGIGNGIYVNSNNYWLDSPNFRVGGATNYLSASDTNFEIVTDNFELNATNIEISSQQASMSLGEGKIVLTGSDRPFLAISQSTFGFMEDGIFLGYDQTNNSGAFSLESSLGTEYLRWDGEHLTISSSQLVLTTESLTVNIDEIEIDANNFELSTQNASMSLGEGDGRIVMQGYNDPYIAISQSTAGYTNDGIFLGFTTAGGKASGAFSLESSTGSEYFRWDGQHLSISSSNLILNEDTLVLNTDILEIDATNFELSTVNASMSLGEGAGRIVMSGDTIPYLAISQSDVFGSPTGVGYTNDGIYIGFDIGAGKASGTLSLESTGSEFLRWDGSRLSVSASGFSLDDRGVITASDADIRGVAKIENVIYKSIRIDSSNRDTYFKYVWGIGGDTRPTMSLLDLSSEGDTESGIFIRIETSGLPDYPIGFIYYPSIGGSVATGFMVFIESATDSGLYISDSTAYGSAADFGTSASIDFAGASGHFPDIQNRRVGFDTEDWAVALHQTVLASDYANHAGANDYGESVEIHSGMRLLMVNNDLDYKMQATNQYKAFQVYGPLISFGVNRAVGIGTRSPVNDLHIYESINDPLVTFNASSTEWSIGVDNDQSDRFHIGRGTNPKSGGAINGEPAISINSGDEFVGIGTTDATERLHVEGTASAYAFSSLSPLRLQTQGTTRLLISDVSGEVHIYDSLYVTGSITTPTDFVTTGNIGIGTTNPLADLHIYENAATTVVQMRIQNANAVGDSGLRFLQSSNNYIIGIDATDGYFKIVSSTSLSLTPALTITTADDVGIGTSAASAKVHIYDSTDPGIAFDYGGTDWFVGVDSSALRFKINTGTAPDALTPAICIETTGFVGIGTSNPRNNFDVHEDNSSTTPIVRFHQAGSGDSTIQMTAGSSWFIGVDNSDTDKFKIGPTAAFIAAPFTIDLSGQVGIGTTAPGAQLHVNGAIQSKNGTVLFADTNESGTPSITDGWRIRWDSSGDVLYFEKTDANATDPDGKMCFVNTGNDGTVEYALTIDGTNSVGIGTSSPDSSWDLHVNSTILATGTVGIGGTSTNRWTMFVNGTNLQFARNGSNLGFLSSAGSNVQINFTGQHRSIPSTSSSLEELSGSVGYIVIADGTYENVFTGSEKNRPTINESLPRVALCNQAYDKRVFGVVSDSEETTSGSREYAIGVFVTQLNKSGSDGSGSYSGTDNRIIVNSVGEGAMWVSNYSGSLENGDYITSAPIPGLGMKQDDDILHNYTVAKITQDCDFDLSSSLYDCVEFEFSSSTYKRAFVGVTYHCG